MNIKASNYLSAISVITVFFTMPFFVCAQEKSVSVSGAQIADYGIYRRSSQSEANAPETNAGYTHVVGSVELIQRTDHIPARLDTAFGIRYTVSGNPNGAIIPVTLNMIHPKIKNPESGKTTAVDRWSSEPKLGKLAYAEWHFDYSWELVPGKWTIQVIYAGKVIAEKEFEVQTP